MKKIIDVKRRFDDIVGYEKEKYLLKETYELVKNKDKYTELGVKIPKSLYIMGPRGVGKSLFAEALAGELGLPMYTLAQEDLNEYKTFIEEMKKMFAVAKENAPSIILIDKIDSLMTKKDLDYISLDYSLDYSDYKYVDLDDESDRGNKKSVGFISSFLNEMKLLKNTDGVLVVATATNKVITLGESRSSGEFLGESISSGAFDRSIFMFEPKLADRIKILQHHTKNIQLDRDVNLEQIARRCWYCNGSGLKNVVDNALTMALTDDRKVVSMEDFEMAIERDVYAEYIVSDESPRKLTDKEMMYKAYGEAGRALIGLAVEGLVVNFTTTTKGDMSYLKADVSSEGFEVITKKEFEAELLLSIAGLAAQKVGLKELEYKSSEHIANTISKLRDALSETGIFGLKYLIPTKSDFYEVPASHHMRYRIDRKAIKLFNKYFKKAVRIMKANKKALDAIAHALMKKPTLYKRDLDKILGDLIEKKKRKGTI